MISVALLAALAAPASADPAGPTHYQSQVVAVEGPGADAVELEVLGGDAFLVLHVAPGTAVEVPGYDDEPYIRIAADGAVEVNERAPSRWLNDARYGAADVDVPPSAAADAPPQWVEVAADGTYAWHDHRIHWMSPSLPSQVDPGAGARQPVFEWSVPLYVDGAEVTVHGQLEWLPGPGPAGAAALPALLLVLGVALAMRRPEALGLLVAIAVVATAGVGVTLSTGLPPGAEGEPVALALPAIAGVLLAVGASRPRGGSRASRQALKVAAGVPLLVWAVTQAGALTRPIVAGVLPTGIVRTVTALALAVGISALVVGARTLWQNSDLEPEAGGSPP